MQCSRCKAHLGWKFGVEKAFDFEPKEFFGVTRSSIYPKFDKENILKNKDEDDEMMVPFMWNEMNVFCFLKSM